MARAQVQKLGVFTPKLLRINRIKSLRVVFNGLEFFQQDRQRKKNLRRSVTLWLELKRLFKQFLLLFFVSQMAFGLFRAIVALGRNMIVANTFWSFAVVTLLALGGFILSTKDMKSRWICGYWISPLIYESL